MIDRKISKAQIEKIFATARSAGIDNDLLHSYVEALTGKESIRELDRGEAKKVIDGLDGKYVERSANPSKEVLSGKQMNMIIYLAIKLGWVNQRNKRLADFDRLNSFVRKEYDTLYVRALSRSNAGKCIEALKSMSERV